MRTIDLHILMNKLRDIRQKTVDFDKKWDGRRYFTPRQVIYLIDRLIEWIDLNATDRTENSAIDQPSDGK